MRAPNKEIPELTEKEKKLFWSKVDRTPGYGPNGDCWEWTRGKAYGYGVFNIKTKPYKAHRISYYLANGSFQSEMLILHRCDNTACVNPGHLFIGTTKDNMVDASIKGRMATGDRNGQRIHPERRPRGDRNGMRLYPEKVKRGESHPRAILNEEQVLKIREEYKITSTTHQLLANKYGVSKSLITKIVNREIWTHT